MFDSPFIIPVVAIVAWAVVAITRARHGVHEDGAYGDAEDGRVPRSFRRMLDSAMAERDAQIDRLRDRVRVLEKIVVDTHESHHLSQEIESLREEHRERAG
jgi:hypothetical protein